MILAIAAGKLQPVSVVWKRALRVAGETESRLRLLMVSEEKQTTGNLSFPDAVDRKVDRALAGANAHHIP